MTLFWEEVDPNAPVVLKPYVARTPIKYELMSDDELSQHVDTIMVFDVECFANYFLIAFRHVATQRVVLFEHPINSDKLEWIMQNYTCVGFNSLNYDLPLLWMAYLGASMQRLKDASTAMINGESNRAKLPVTRHIDLIEVCPGNGSLKLYGARLHAQRIQDVPWAAQENLEDWQIAITRDYCINDLELTTLVFEGLKEQLELRVALPKVYRQDLMSKSDAQIAETVIGYELKQLTGVYPSKSRSQKGEVLRFHPPKNLFFNSTSLRNVLSTVENAEFIVSETGYITPPKVIDDLKIEFGKSIYRMGIGGLHSSEKNMAVHADAKHVIVDRDVASYYPAIIINNALCPKNMGENFLTIFRSLVERRLNAKAAGDQAVSESLKVTINGTFGKTGSPYSILYAPELIIQVTMGGQLYLLMLIERIEAAGIPVISANTDGVVMYCAKSKLAKLRKTITEWEQITGFVTEETEYSALYSRDVNAYLAVKANGQTKGKNVYYDPWSNNSARDSYWRFQKNPVCQICVEAVQKLLVDNIAIRETIEECRDIRKFVAIKNVTGGAHYENEYLGKVVRWYYAKGATGTINYISNSRIVADTEGSRPLMDLPENFPNDIDYQKYIERCRGLLNDMGYKNALAHVK